MNSNRNIAPDDITPAVPFAPNTGAASLLRIRNWIAAWASTPAAVRRDFTGYPKNHAYLVRNGAIVPGYRLDNRWRHITPHYPATLTSLLDVGCCRGYFVLEAASRPTCRAALGIDVHEPFVALARRVAQQTRADRARFTVAGVNDVANDPHSCGGPFQTVLLLNVYHYLFWGSDLNATILANGHDRIFDLLAKVCTDRVIFSSPLDLDDCPQQIRRRAAELPASAALYTTAAFRAAAEKHFSIQSAGHWGRRPLLVLHRR